jgi:formamidopyrimidine-DNA glycosylase
MPELPDVESFRRILQRNASRHVIKKVEVRDEWILRGVSADAFRTQVQRKRLTSTSRHGKYLLAALEPNGFIVFHFGMTGYFQSYRHQEPKRQYNRVIFYLDDGKRIAFNCRRRLGSIRYVQDPGNFIMKQNLGPDALQIDFETYLKRLQGRKGAVKCVLMDQSVLSGIGNIYADEILFNARIHPRRSVATMDDRQTRLLFDAIRRVLNTAVDRNADASRFPRTYLLHRRRKGGTCPRCGSLLDTLSACGYSIFLSEGANPAAAWTIAIQARS